MEDLFLGKDVIVANTFINYWEVAPYIWLAKLAGVDCIVYEPDFTVGMGTTTEEYRMGLAIELHERCKHGVPIETISNHLEYFHWLEVNQLIKEVKRYTTGLLE